MSSKKNDGGKNKPLKKEDIPKHPDKHIDQDFEGYPHNPANENIISPGSKTDKLTAGLSKNQSAGTQPPQKHELRKELEDVDEQLSDGSGGAFSETEATIPPPDEEDQTGKIY
jgi:hypothetical protein